MNRTEAKAAFEQIVKKSEVADFAVQRVISQMGKVCKKPEDKVALYDYVTSLEPIETGEEKPEKGEASATK